MSDTKTTDNKETAKEEPMRYGVPVSEFEKLSLREQKNLEMADTESPLRNQVTVQDIVDHQLMTNAPAETIVAMTNVPLEKLAERAQQLATTLKGSKAGDFQPNS